MSEQERHKKCVASINKELGKSYTGNMTQKRHTFYVWRYVIFRKSIPIYAIESHGHSIGKNVLSGRINYLYFGSSAL